MENQKELFVGEAASALKKNIKQMEEGHQKGEEYQNEEQKADEEYQRAQAAQMEEKKRQESEKENAEKQEESDTDIKETEAVQAKVENPLDQIKKIKSMGIPKIANRLIILFSPRFYILIWKMVQWFPIRQ